MRIKNTRILGVLIISLALALMVPAVSSAIEINPIADSYVTSGSPNNNYGDRPGLYVRATTAQTYDSYLKFDLTGIVPPGYTISELELYVYVISNTQAGEVDANLTTNGWTEMGITWNNAPAAGTLLDTQTAPAASGWVEFDLLANGSTWLADVLAEDYLSVVLNLADNPGEGLPYFASKDNTNIILHPYLDITLIPIPLPPSALLLGSGLLGLAIAVSRKKKIY